MLDKKKEEFLRRGLWIKSHATQYLEELAQKEREESTAGRNITGDATQISSVVRVRIDVRVLVVAAV